MNNITFPWNTTDNNYTVNNTSDLITEDSTSQVEDDTNLINFGTDLNVTLDSSGEITVDVDTSSSSFEDTRVNATDNGTNSVTDVKSIDFGTNLSYTVGGSNNNELTVVAAGGATLFQIPQVQLKNGEGAVGLRYRIPDGETHEFTSVGVQNDSSNVPTGLNVELYDDTNSTLVIDQNSIYHSGSPIASLTGPVDVEVRISNNTGSEQLASGFMFMESSSGTGGDTRTDVSDSGGLVQDETNNIKFTSGQDSNSTGDLAIDVSTDGSGGATVDYSFTGSTGSSPLDAWATIITDLNDPSNSTIKGQNVGGPKKIGRGVWRISLDPSIGSTASHLDPDIEMDVSSYLGWTTDEQTKDKGVTFHSWEQNPDDDNAQEVEIKFINENGNVADPKAFSVQVIDVS